MSKNRLMEVAPEGQIYVCSSCGKTSKNKIGYVHYFLHDVGWVDEPVADKGWDESCMLNSVLCWEKKVFCSEGDFVGMAWNPVEAQGE